jgi:hypothetical protein
MHGSLEIRLPVARNGFPERKGVENSWVVVQSRSAASKDPWLEKEESSRERLIPASGLGSEYENSRDGCNETWRRTIVSLGLSAKEPGVAPDLKSYGTTDERPKLKHSLLTLLSPRWPYWDDGYNRPE